MTHRYDHFEDTELWRAIDNALAELEKNADVSVSTARHLVIGFMANAVARVCIPVNSKAEYIGVANALNEVCHGFEIDDAEFQTRIGIERGELIAILRRLSKNA